MKRFEIIDGKCVIPEGTDYIEDYEFYCSDDLREIVFPESLSSIGRYSFCGCRNLEGLKIPASVHTIGSYAFSECGRDEGVKIPGTVRLLGREVSSIYVPEEIDDEDHLVENDLPFEIKTQL